MITHVHIKLDPKQVVFSEKGHIILAIKGRTSKFVSVVTVSGNKAASLKGSKDKPARSVIGIAANTVTGGVTRV